MYGVNFLSVVNGTTATSKPARLDSTNSRNRPSFDASAGYTAIVFVSSVSNRSDSTPAFSNSAVEPPRVEPKNKREPSCDHAGNHSLDG